MFQKVVHILFSDLDFIHIFLLHLTICHIHLRCLHIVYIRKGVPIRMISWSYWLCKALFVCMLVSQSCLTSRREGCSAPRGGSWLLPWFPGDARKAKTRDQNYPPGWCSWGALLSLPWSSLKEVRKHLRWMANVFNIPKGVSRSEVLSPELRNFTVLNLHVNWTFCNKAPIKELKKEALRGSQI